MQIFRSRPAIALAAAAVLSMAASPAFARGWHRHRGVDTGDVFAGLLIFGGIAAIAAAASNSNRERRVRGGDYRYPDRDYRDYRDYRDNRYPEREYRDDRGYVEPPVRYGEQPRSDPYSGSWRGGGSMDGAVDVCVNQVQRGDRQVETVESVSREADGWRVDGLITGGRDYSCAVDRDGRVRSVTVDGRPII